MRRMIVACTLLLAISGTAAAAQIFKWTDAQGNVHFGERPPQGLEATRVNPNIHQPQVSSQAPTVIDEADPLQDKLDSQARASEAKRLKEVREFCDSARHNLAQLRSNPRTRINIDGEQQRLSEDQRQQRMQELENSIKEHCR